MTATDASVTTIPDGLALAVDDLDLLAHLAETGVSLLRHQMISGVVPDIHLTKVNATCKRGDQLIAQLRAFMEAQPDE